MTETALSHAFTIRSRTWVSRLIGGTLKDPTFEIMSAAHPASGAEIVAVAGRKYATAGSPLQGVIGK